MQIRAEQILADISIYLSEGACQDNAAKKQISKFSKGILKNIRETIDEDKFEGKQHMEIAKEIRQKLASPPPKLSQMPLEDSTLAVRSPFITRHEFPQTIPYHTHSNESNLFGEAPSHYPYAPLTRFYPEQSFEDLTKEKIDEFGLLELKEREDIPVSADLSPVFQLPGANGKAAIEINALESNFVKEKEILQMSPAKKLYSELELYRFADETVENQKIEKIINTQKLLDPLKHEHSKLEDIYDEEYDQQNHLKHWSMINFETTFNTTEICEIMDENANRQEIFNLANRFDNPLFFFDVSNYDLQLEKGEIIRNVVYKAVMERYRFAAGELFFLLNELIIIAGDASCTIKGNPLIKSALCMYFNGEIPEELAYKAMLVPRKEVPSAGELDQIEHIREQQEAYEEELKRENEELKSKIGAVLVIQHYVQFKRIRRQYVYQKSKIKDDEIERFKEMEDRFFIDVLPYYTRFDELVSDSTSSVSRSIDLPLLDCGFWESMQGKQIDQRVLIFMYLSDEFYAPFDQLGGTYEHDNWNPELSEAIICILIDPRVHLCIISPFSLQEPRSHIFNAIDAIHGKLGDAESRLHLVKVDVESQLNAMRGTLGITVSHMFLLLLKSNYMHMLELMQAVIDTVAPDISFQILTVEQTLIEHLIELAHETKLPLHEYCPELMHFSQVVLEAKRLNGTSLIHGRLLNYASEYSALATEQNAEAPTYLIRPDYMLAAPGQDLFFSEVGGIGIEHLIKGQPYTIFENIDYERFYSQFGCYFEPYYQESSIKEYVSYSSTAYAREPEFYYTDIMARSYVNFGRTMSAGSISEAPDTSIFNNFSSQEVQSFESLIQNILKANCARGRFECGVLAYKEDGALLFEFNQLVVGYTRRYLSHIRSCLERQYRDFLKRRENSVFSPRASTNMYLFILNLYNESFVALLHELRAQKFTNTDLCACNGYALDIVVSGDTYNQLLNRANDALSVLQNKSGGESRMRLLLGNLDCNSMHELESEIERTGTSAFYVCAINTMLEQE